jgi:hypothetical protein
MIHAVTGMRTRGARHMKWRRSGLRLLLLGLYGRFGLSVTSLHATFFEETPGKDT